MHYPFWDVGIGYGILMAAIAVPHVFVSHFAIGGGLYLVLAERAARKAGDDRRLGYLERLSRFFVLVTLVFGALTGVGIWFIIGLLNPTATEALIHTFVWGWAIEWTFFIVEILAAALYYYGWQRMEPRDHMVLGWIYFAAAWLSLFVINGIITFMLTPGRWLQTGSFLDGFFNPTFWPSLVFRTGVCIMLAGLFSLLVAVREEPPEFTARLVRRNSVWGITGLVIMAPSFYWYWRAIPGQITSTAVQSMTTPIFSIQLSYWLAALIAVSLAVFGLLLPKRLHFSVAVVVMALGLGWFGTFEWFRESIRKPFIVSGYMYGNALEVAREPTYRKDGYLRVISYTTGDDAADLFRHACRSCHTMEGHKALKPAFDGTDAAFIAAIVKSTHLLRGNMPPFWGSAQDASLIAAHIQRRIDTRHLGEIYRLQGIELGRKVYDIRCAGCHQIGGATDKTGSIAGLTDSDYETVLDMASELGEGMPAFTGDAVERAALIQYFRTLNQGGDK